MKVVIQGVNGRKRERRKRRMGQQEGNGQSRRKIEEKNHVNR